MAWRNAGLAGFAVWLASALPGLAADTVTCRDADGRARLDYDIRFNDDSRGPGTVTRVFARFADFDISTEPDGSGRRPEVISDQKSDHDRLELDLEDPSIAKIVLRLRLFRDQRYDETDKEYDEHVVAGTLSVMSQGVWAVTCSGW